MLFQVQQWRHSTGTTPVGTIDEKWIDEERTKITARLFAKALTEFDSKYDTGS